MENALELAGVSKVYGQFIAVDQLSLKIPMGTIYGFLGPNGAGKTTTIRMIMSIIYPDQGSICVLGYPNSEVIKDRLGYLPEEKGLYKKMKTLDMVAYFGTLKGLGFRESRQRARNLLIKYGLGDWLNRKCETLSKGMGQKVQILSTLIHDPELVILDEPFSGLDPVNVEVMRDLILQMKRDGRTVIFSTHVMEQAEKICDSIFLIHRGQKIIDGPLHEIKASGGHGLQIDYEGDGQIIRSHPDIERMNDSGKHAEIFLKAGRNPQTLLASLIGKITIRRFDLSEPSLHEIFVRAVGGTSDE